MKHLFVILFATGALAGSMTAQEQQTVTSRRTATVAPESQTTVSIRAQNKYGYQETNTDNVVWLREIYRQLDLKQEKNGPLYFPVEPIGDRINLFTLIFNLLAEGKISSYEYLDGREVFTDQYRNNFKEVLSRFSIPYEEKFAKSAKNPLYAVHESDVPSNEVLGFYIKEVWYFDQANSTFDSKIVALCPLLFRMGDFGDDALRYPMFWVTYDDLRPYLTQAQIMTSNYNNVLSTTFDDYFRQRMYKGDIYKATNLANVPLVQYATTDSLMQIERKRIENELIAFEGNLWGKPDPVEIQAIRSKKRLTSDEKELLRKFDADKKSEKQEKQETETAAVSEEQKTAEETTQEAEKKSVKPEKASKSKAKTATPKPSKPATPTRSVRRR
ncbi:MAG: gliding motility protein GldN [Bacteroidales bacterium]|jgi:gliding motility associated protien GldN|nr:gliding motility protein GldN [Bacteroidales bacterium]